MEDLINRYYLTDVDANTTSIYCYHDEMNELLIDRHRHQKHQLIYTIGGIVYVKTEHQTYYLPARHFMWIPAGIFHSIHTNRADTIMSNLYFPVQESEGEFFSTEGIYPIDELLFQLFEYAKDFPKELFDDNQDTIVALAIRRVVSSFKDQKMPFSLPIAKSERLDKILKFLHQAEINSFNYNDIVNQFGFTERTLHRQFKKELGISYIQYVALLKIVRAIELLVENKLTISEIALEVGYSSVATFSNTFWKYTNKRPSEYLISKRH